MEIKIKDLVRIGNTDVRGTHSVYSALRKIKGVGFMFSNALCSLTGIDKTKKVGLLTEEEIKKFDSLIKSLDKIPKWILNRRKDYESGEDVHLTNQDLKLRKELDIKRLKRMKLYRGMRHSAGLPTRGQRTKSHFRNKKKANVVRKKIGAKKE